MAEHRVDGNNVKANLPPFPPCCASCEDLGRLVGETRALPAIDGEQVHGLQFRIAHQQPSQQGHTRFAKRSLHGVLLVHSVK